MLEDDVTNARELGGHPLTPDGYVDCQKIYRGGHLGNLTDTGCREFSDLGVKTVIDLRMETTQQNAPPPACVTGQATVVDAAMPKLLPDNVDNYLALMSETDAVAAAFEALGNAAAYPVYIHCVIGRDRASFITALVLLALGASNPQVIYEFEFSEKAGIEVKTECIQAILDEVNNRGGIEAYLTSAGVTSNHLEILRSEAIKNE
jgi:protein-tyrosine phosphatase